MKKFIKKYKKTFGMLLLILAITFFIFWEFIGRSELLHENIIVLKEDVIQGQIITADMLIRAKIPVENCNKNAIQNVNDLVGQEAKHYIPANTQVFKEYIDVPELVLSQDQKIMRLSPEWILSFPETLRRKDKIFLYAVKTDDRNVDDEENRDSENIKKQEVEKIFVYSTVVAYVKDNANREVVSLDTNRFTGSSTISVIELITTDSDFKLIEDFAKKGYKFTLMYK